MCVKADHRICSHDYAAHVSFCVWDTLSERDTIWGYLSDSWTIDSLVSPIAELSIGKPVPLRPMHADAILLCSEAEFILISAICSTSQTHFILHYKPLWKTVTLGKQHITQTNMRERQWVLYDLLFSPPTERRDGEKDTRGGKPHATHRCCLSQRPSMHPACRTDGVSLKLAPHVILSIYVD